MLTWSWDPDRIWETLGLFYTMNVMSEDEHTLTINLDMTNNNPNRFKYSEEELLKELKDYISATYNTLFCWQ